MLPLKLPRELCKMVQSLAAIIEYVYVGDAPYKKRLLRLLQEIIKQIHFREPSLLVQAPSRGVCVSVCVFVVFLCYS